MRTVLLLLKEDPEGKGWAREDPLTFEDDPAQSGEGKARAYGDEWVREDPDHRDYSVIPEKLGGSRPGER